MTESRTPDKLDDSLLDQFGGSVLKILDRQNILRDRESLVATPLVKLISWNIAPETIVKLKTSKAPFVTAFDYFQQKEKFRQIKFEVASLDLLTEGGIDVGSVTELFGEAGSGKSQLCMQLAINCALAEDHGGLSARAIYISTDKRFAISRLHQMAVAKQGYKTPAQTLPHKLAGSLKRKSPAQTLPNATASSLKLSDFNPLDKIEITELRSSEALARFIEEKLPQRLELHPGIRLVVIDSIAGLFRHEQDYIRRAEDMRAVVIKLERLADLHNFAIVMTNHITAVPGSGEPVSCLGIAFENLVVTKMRV